MPTITLQDASLQGQQQSPWQMDIFEEQSTLREILRSRIYQEVSEYNAQKRSQSLCLITLMPVDPPQADAAPPVDWQTHYERAIEAFKKRRYLVLINGRQMTKLDAPVHLTDQTTITFLKLIPLIGG
ncbi:hypothetical protein [Dictyobacter arantiisoli]|uniref:Uncharacterized protein n=1 Tax=Dictyobacter arantiisoli TaxID=2014874 RepID=A0A5A5TAG8_9CHLR|nr:hypothetical protein [Dictyobacter arantiisoli]GCF07979.1 hypothetical protein KDI_15430 [Dictyobacter arantiisoli]